MLRLVMQKLGGIRAATSRAEFVQWALLGVGEGAGT